MTDIKLSELAGMLEPFVMNMIGQAAGGVGPFAPSPHDLGSSHHTGSISDAQATQFLKTDGSRQLSGNLAVAAGITIDGVDLGDFKGIYDAHISGDGHPSYLNITRHDTTARHGSSVVDHGSIGGLGDDDHSQYVHLSIDRTISATHDFTNGFKIGADVQLSRKSANVMQLASGDEFQSASYTSGISGWKITADGSAEFSNVRVRGELVSAIFKVNEIQATAGTFGVFKSASTTTQDVALPALSGSFHLFIKTSDAAPTAALVAVNDVLRIKSWNGSAVTDSWMTVTAVSSAAGVTDATCTLNSGTASATIKAGTAVVDYGPTGSGFITLSADGAVGSSANITVADHTGSPWMAQTVRARLGNLNGVYNISSDSYGIGLGDYSSGNYLRYEPTNGFILKSGNGGINIDSSGISLNNANTSYSQPSALVFNNVNSSDQIATIYGFKLSGFYNFFMESIKYNGIISPSSKNAAGLILKTSESATVPSLDLYATYGITSTTYLRFLNSIATLYTSTPSGTASIVLNPTSIALTGTQINVTGEFRVPILTSTIATGTAPLVVTSTTKVTNLNADSVDGFHATQSGAASSVVATDASGNLSIGPMWAYSFSGRYTYTCAKNSAALLAPGSGVFVVRGSISGNNFIDLVVHQSYSAGVVKVASSIYGTPPGRTYSDSGGSLYLTLDNTGTDGTYAIGVNVLLA